MATKDSRMRRGRDKLVARRRALGHTQESLAEVLDVAVSTVARWEQGIGWPLPALRQRLADALSVSLDGLDRLLGGDGDLEEQRGKTPNSESENWVVAVAEDETLRRRHQAFAGQPVSALVRDTGWSELDDINKKINALLPSSQPFDVTAESLEEDVERRSAEAIDAPPVSMISGRESGLARHRGI